MQQTNLWDVRKKALGGYSGGMKQRFGIAQALLANPKLIIVDEPTAGLDPAERNRFLNLLSSIGRNVVVILSTHIVEDVRELCSRMAMISNGELLLEGAPAQTLEALEAASGQDVVTDSNAKLAEDRSQLQVVSTHLSAARTRCVSIRNPSRREASLPWTPSSKMSISSTLSRHQRNLTQSYGASRMFLDFFLFELKLRFKSISTYVFFLMLSS